MDFIVRYRVRRHLSASAPRRQGKGPAGLNRFRAKWTPVRVKKTRQDRAQKKQDPLGSCFRISRCRPTSIVAAIKAVMMEVVMMVMMPIARPYADAVPVCMNLIG